MRDMRKGICPLCEHNEVIVTHPVEKTHGGWERQLAIIDVFVEQEGLFATPKLTTTGKLDAYTCRACGYTQWFARDPALIPEKRVQIIRGAKPDGPYR